MKNKTSLLVVLGTVVLVSGLVWLASAGGDSDITNYSQSSLSVQEDYFDFGTIAMEDGLVDHEYVVMNEGEEPVAIKKAYTSCMCTVSYIYDTEGREYGPFGMMGHGRSPSANVVVEPGETAKVVAVFDPAAHGPSGVGLAERIIYLETNSARSPKTELSFRAMVTR